MRLGHVPAGRTVGTAVLALLTACGSYEHTNLLDPQTKISADIVGPDSAVSLGQFVDYVVRSTPEWTASPLVFSSSDTTILQAVGGGGRFKVVGFGRIGGTGRVYVEAQLGPRRFEKLVVVTPVPARLTFPPPGYPGITELESLTEERKQDVIGWDAMDNPINSDLLQAPLATFSVRDTTVAVIIRTSKTSFTVSARRNGGTWVIARGGRVTDSVQVTVRQAATRATFSPSCGHDYFDNPYPLKAGGSMQITGVKQFDALDFPLGTPEPLDFLAPDIPAAPSWGYFPGKVTVTPAGLVTAVTPGWAAVLLVNHRSSRVVASCMVHVLE